MVIRISSLAVAKQIKRRFDAVLTIEDPSAPRVVRFHSTPHPDHLVLRFEDVDHPHDDIALPSPLHVEQALEFGRRHVDGDLLIHCKVGVARSTAIGLGIIADRLGVGREDEAVQELLRIRPESVPNLLILGFMDDELGRNGALVDAWHKVERSDQKYARHRMLKQLAIERSPALFSKPVELSDSVWAYDPDSLEKRLVIYSGPTP